MTIDHQHITDLLEKAVSGALSTSELEALVAYAKAQEHDPVFIESMQQHLQAFEPVNSDDISFWNERKDAMYAQLIKLQQGMAGNAAAEDTAINPPMVHRIHFLRRGFFRYAAAILLVFGTGAYFWFSNKKTEQPLVSDNKPLQTNIVPGGDRAVLTLADGTTIMLDSAANGDIAHQGNSSVVKLADGKLVYKYERGSYPPSEGVARSAGGGQEGELPTYNTMTTPRGGQYQLTLPDGTKVWLNASSSITFPTSFTQSQRKVTIEGELYFEVKQNKEKPFIVDVNGQSTVEVLGTSFNINAYTDEKATKTTLISGSVKIAADRKTVVLRPGQQALITSGISVSSNIDPDQALAWKNGLFNFKGADLRTVMRQLERWYDIKVNYAGTASDIVLEGELYSSAPLSDVLDVLKEIGVKFELDGKNLTVY